MKMPLGLPMAGPRSAIAAPRVLPTYPPVWERTYDAHVRSGERLAMPNDETPNLKLPYIIASQAQKHVTHNEAIRTLDAIVQIGVLDRDMVAPPATPADGERHIVPSGATGAWASQTGKLAAFQDGGWAFFAPVAGWLAWVASEQRLVVWDGADWVPVVEFPALASLLGINTTADVTNRLAVKSDALLFSHDDVTPGSGDLQLKLNKSAPARTVSQLYQSNWSGRAETGLTGDDDFHVKVSPDGATWREAIIANRSTGKVTFPFSAYEETETGTFTPVLGATRVGSYAGATSIAVTYARYTKIGKLVICRLAFTIAGLTTADIAAGSALSITGLPFAVADLSGTIDMAGVSGAAYRGVATAQNTVLAGYVAATTSLFVFAFPLASNNARNTDTHFLSIVYEAA